LVAIGETAICALMISLPYIIRAYWILKQLDVNLIFKTAEEEALIKLGNIKRKKLSLITKWTFLCFAIVSIIFLAAFIVDADDFMGSCNGGITISRTSPSFIILLIYYVILFFTLFTFSVKFVIRQIQDIFNIKYELFLQQFILVSGVTLALFKIPLSLPPTIIILFSINFTITFAWPLLSSFFIRKRQLKSNLELENVLNNPVYLLAFIEHCIKEFSTEQPLFYGDYNEFIRKYEQSPNYEEKEKLILRLYNKYFCDDSPLQLNLTHNIVKEINSNIQTKI